MANLPPKLRWAIFLAIAALALAVRLPHLGQRPMHTDEAINAYITGQLLAGEKYQYDPQDRHGPALYAVAWPIARLAGAKSFADLTETSVRLGPVIAGVLTVLLFIALANRIGTMAAGAAALLFAIAPLPVYYSRYFIHETLFVIATLGLIVFGFQAMENKSLRNGILCGLCAGLMLACKETAVLHFGAFGIAGAWLMISLRSPAISEITFGKHSKMSFVKAGCAALAGFLLVIVVLYTWGGTHPGGLTDLFRSFPRMISRAGGQGHEKPAWYYFGLLSLGWSGFGVLILALWGAFRAVRGGAAYRVLQALVIYTLIVGALYCAIPYKTPWLALNLFLPLAVLAGYGAGQLWEMARTATGRMVFGIVAIALAAALGRDTWKSVFLAPADERNPYAYAHTVEDLLRLPERVARIASDRHLGKDIRIAVIARDPWPLPWYLRKFPNTGFWQPNQELSPADIYITSPEAAGALEDRLKDWRPEFFGVRPEVLIILWFRPEPEARHE